MAKAVKDSFLDLERHRQLLEESIEKLKWSLQHWQTWEAEYEGLKEEILSIGPAPSHEQLKAVGSEFGGKLVTRAEVEDILGVKISRSADQVTNILSRRIDYVSQNVKTLEKQLEAAENKLVAATIISNPDVRNEEGLPLTEIIEELDEDGNVVSGRTETRGSTRGQLLEVLEKAGLKDLPGIGQEKEPGNPSTGPVTSTSITEGEAPAVSALSKTLKKSVQFEQGTKEVLMSAALQTAARTEAMRNNPKQQNSVLSERPVLPSNESPEDAALRKEMLQYGISEVGALVAELNLEDDGDFSSDDDDYNDDGGDDASSADDEDEFGRSTRKVMDEDMRRRMIELEERLGLRKMENLGSSLDVSIGDGFSSETLDMPDVSQVPTVAKEKKGVRFAEELDISKDRPKAISSEPPKPKTTAPQNPPIRDIVERAPSIQETQPASIPPQKISRFKSAREARPLAQLSVGVTNATQSTPESHSTPNVRLPSPKLSTPIKLEKPLTGSIVEREIPASTPQEPDLLDLTLLQQEAATEYHRRRNRMIQKQGGFMKDLELEKGVIPLTEEEGGPKKMSRFKAARLAGT